MESYKIIHSEYKYRVCNICNEAQINEDNKSGVCAPCIENKIDDGVWTKEQAYSENLRTDENGFLITN